MFTHDRPAPASDSATKARTEARQADYVAFLHRVPFVVDALNMGFLPGFREDCSYQQQQFTDLECPVGMLDNDFRNPNLERYVERIFEHEPGVGIVGDAYDIAEARRYVDTIRELEGSFLDSELIDLDWYGVHRDAQFGEFWTANSWDDSGRDADHVSVRDVVRYDFNRIRSFWQVHGV